jgi:mono/diheme cytochrome c family protein
MHKLLISVATITLVASAQASAAADIAAGKLLYEDNCAICHGSNAEGKPAKGNAAAAKKLAGDSAYWDFPVFKRTVMEGIDDKGRAMKTMPVFGKTGFLKPKGAIPTDAELQDIQAYLKSLGPEG